MKNLSEGFLETLFSVIPIMTVGLISGLIGWYLSNGRHKAEVRAKHFEEIKKEVS
jgi:tetrahydromethanopterin S-methyltransferase subunit C